jgi:hypothetical protein
VQEEDRDRFVAQKLLEHILSLGILVKRHEFDAICCHGADDDCYRQYSSTVMFP